MHCFINVYLGAHVVPVRRGFSQIMSHTRFTQTQNKIFKKTHFVNMKITKLKIIE